MAPSSSNSHLPADGPEVCSRFLMSGVYVVECDGCGQRHGTSADQARKQRVMRCECGQFVRLDRGLTELRSEPARAAMPAELTAAGDEEEATHMLSSLSAVAALRGGLRGRATLASLHEDEHGSSLPAPRGTLRSLASAPSHHPPSNAPTDKKLWYVDLGGSRTVEMTIEQLIVARRSGKLGEGALVWREGMAHWRPVGTLIPATSVATGRLTPVPPAPSRAPPPAPSRPPAPLSRPASGLRPPAPSRPPEPIPQSLASYERPLATLEFALDRPESTRPASATRSPLPTGSNASRVPSRPPPRAVTPVPRPATWLASSAPNASSRPLSRAPSVAVPLSPPSAPPAPRATPIPTPLPSFTSDRPVEAPVTSGTWDWLGQRPRWVSACIALAVCITASGSGAYLVRTLKTHRQPLVAATSAADQPLPGTTTSNHVAPLAPAAPASAPLVVDLQSLSVERSAPRRIARPVAVPVARPAREPEPEAVEPALETTDPIDDDPSTSSPSLGNKAKNADVPIGNPYTTVDSDDSAPKKPKHTANDE